MNAASTSLLSFNLDEKLYPSILAMRSQILATNARCTMATLHTMHCPQRNSNANLDPPAPLLKSAVALFNSREHVGLPSSGKKPLNLPRLLEGLRCNPTGPLQSRLVYP